MLERSGVEVLRLVDDQDRIESSAHSLDEEMVEGDQTVRVAILRPDDAEIFDDVGEDLVKGHHRVKDEGGLRRAVEAVEERSQKRRLAGSDLSDQHHESPTFLDPVLELSERLAVRRREVQESRVGRRLNGFS